MSLGGRFADINITDLMLEMEKAAVEKQSDILRQNRNAMNRLESILQD